MKVTTEIFGKIGDTPIQSFTLKNDHGIEVTCINYGCIITKIITPDQNGTYENIVLGYDSLEEYVNDTSFLGAVCGRVAGRIGGASFSLDGTTYTLAKNENNNHLHGGSKGFNRVIWNAAVLESVSEPSVQFSYLSQDGEEGYPGNLTIKVTYTLTNNNEFVIQYEGQSDQNTLLNVTNHSYFNLSGNIKSDVSAHTLKLKSNQFLELNNEFLPTGELVNVENTPFDFGEERIIQSGITSGHHQNILVGNGYDHPFILSEHQDEEIVLKDSNSGRTLTVETDEVGVVVYSGNNLPSTGEIRGVPSRKYLGICLETQGLPDAVHHPSFPSVILNKDETYQTSTKYKFGVLDN